PPTARTLWPFSHMANECLAVMDATDTASAILVALCDGVAASIQLAASNPERILGIVAIAPGMPLLTPPMPARAAALANWDKELDSYEGWSKENRHYIEG